MDSKRYEWVRVDSWDNLTISKYLIILPVTNNVLVSGRGFCALTNLSLAVMMFLHIFTELDVRFDACFLWIHLVSNGQCLLKRI